MKSKEIRAAKSPKNNKRTSVTDANFPKEKSAIASQENDYLAPMHIKIPKNKIKAKKQNKLIRNEVPIQDRTTKRNYKKKGANDFTGTVLANQAIENRDLKKENREECSHRVKIEEKTKRNSNRAIFTKQSSKQSWFNNLLLKNTLTQTEDNLLKKQHSPKQMTLTRPQEQYLFIGNEFYLVNNYCPTKRLLNTFREACIQQNSMSKFITQDKGQKKAKAKIEVKKNIFQAARKEIEMKNKICKAMIIQKWWKKILSKRNLQTVKSNPENVKCGLKFEKNIAFDFIPESATPIKLINKDASIDNQSIEMVGFSENSQQTVNERIIFKPNCDSLQVDLPKKIEFHHEDLSPKLMQPYILPQDDTNLHENDDIFNSSPKFHIEQASNLDESDDSCYTSPIKSQKSFDQAKQIECIPQQKQQMDQTLLKQFQEAVKMKEMMDLRIAVQKGQIKSAQTNPSKLGINTSILGIHNFLVRFFNFYIQKYREEFINFINMPFGQSIITRLRHLNGRPLGDEIEEDDQGIIYGLKEVIDDDKYEEFYKWLEFRDNKNGNTFAKTNLQLERIHNKSILDVFNQQLNEYRPYRQINGVPYPWNISHKALTFYFVTDDNISEIFQKIELNILKNSSLLCGIILPEEKPKQIQQKEPTCFDMTSFMDSYEEANHRMIVEHNDAREKKVIQEQIKQQSFECDSESLTSIMFQISSQIFNHLVQESMRQMTLLAVKTNIY